MAFAEGPFNLLPSCSHRFLPWAGFFSYRWSQKNRNCAFILTAKAKEVCGQRLGGNNLIISLQATYNIIMLTVF